MKAMGKKNDVNDPHNYLKKWLSPFFFVFF